MEEKKPTHRVTIVTYDYQVTGGKAHVDRNFEVHARDTACAMIAAQLEVQRLNETTNAKWQILKVLEFGRRDVPGSKARFTFNADLIPEGEDHE
jgi:hypothetical protein